MHWFLVKQSSTNLKKTLNTCLYKLSFCYFYHDEIYLSHENFHKFSLEGLYKTQIIEKKWNGKLQIWGQKSNTPKSHTHNCTLLLCYPIFCLE